MTLSQKIQTAARKCIRLADAADGARRTYDANNASYPKFEAAQKATERLELAQAAWLKLLKQE